MGLDERQSLTGCPPKQSREFARISLQDHSFHILWYAASGLQTLRKDDGKTSRIGVYHRHLHLPLLTPRQVRPLTVIYSSQFHDRRVMCMIFYMMGLTSVIRIPVEDDAVTARYFGSSTIGRRASSEL